MHGLRNNFVKPGPAERAVLGWALGLAVTTFTFQVPGAGQQAFAAFTAWVYEPGWQWEIATFDLVLAWLLTLLARAGLASRVLPVLLLLGCSLGANHLYAALEAGRPGNWLGAAANGVGLIVVLAAMALGKVRANASSASAASSPDRERRSGGTPACHPSRP